MSKRHLLLPLFVAMLLGVPAARAQQYTPLISSGRFSNDYQFFAPAVWEDLGRNRPGNTGWFVDLHRMYVYTQRPEDGTRLIGPDGGDWSWGNRFDLGYMDESNHGWLVSGYEIGSPNAIDVVQHEQLNRVNEDFNDFLEDPTADDLELQLPRLDRNNPITNERTFFEQTSINTFKANSAEIMKTWRMRPFHNRGFWEPMVGLRYVKLRDITLADNYLRLDEDGLPLDELVDEDAEIEVLTSDTANFLNHVVMAQIGFRLQVPHGRWTLNHELRTFCGNNWQQYDRRITDLILRYDGNGSGAELELTEIQAQRISGNHTEFVFGTDARAEAAYHVTRDLMVSTGVQYQYLARGIGRGNNFFQNEQDFGMLSAVFGVTYNR